ncbi:MAG TPA: aquaporin [Tepidisphaeraceae bacterium]|nr:aquaporin [Tepidisphaeraceae bacterium]
MSFRSYLTEFIGTFFLVLTIGLSIKGNKTDEPFLLAPLAIGSSLMIMIYMGGYISGAHYNPAVSLAVLLRGKMAGRDFVPYAISQCAGAFIAVLTVYAILGKTFAPADGVSAARTIFVEVLYTFALALVVLNTATAPQVQDNSYFGLAIGFTVVVGAIAGGGISGGAFNPAVGTGPILASNIPNGSTLANVWLYWLGPCAGGALAAIVYHLQHAPVPDLVAEPLPNTGAV